MTENGCAENGNFGEAGMIIETTDEEGQVHVFEKLREIEVDGKEYALLIYRGEGEGETPDATEASESDEEDEGEVVVMRISYEEDNQEVYEAIEDEAEFEKVVAFIEGMDEEDFAIDLGEFISQMKDDTEHESKN